MGIGEWYARRLDRQNTVVPVVVPTVTREIRVVEEARSIGGFDRIQTPFGLTGVNGSVYSGNEWYRGALTHPAVWRGANLLANLIASLPFRAYVDRDDNVSEQVLPTPVVLTSPCPPLTSYKALHSMVLDYLLEGNGVAIVTARDGEGMPTAYLPVPARFVQTRWNESDGAMPWLHDPSQRIYRIGDLELGPNDVLHFMGPSTPGALRGMGVIETLAGSLDLARTLNRQALDVATNASVPTGVVTTSDPLVTKDDLEDLKRTFTRAQRERTVAAVNGQVKYEAVGWSPDDAQLLESRQFSLTEIALALGLPAHFLLASNDGGLTYSTTALEGQDLLRYGKPAELLAAFEAELSRHMPDGVCVRADTSHLVRADQDAMAKYYAAAITGGWLTPNDVRAELGLPPLPGVPSTVSDTDVE